MSEGRALNGALAFAAAVVVTIEFSAVGLLPALARDLDVSLDAAGWLVGGFALASSVAGPPLTAWATRREPRWVMSASLAVFAVGNLAAAAAPSYATVMAVRLAEGALLPVFFSLAIRTLVDQAPDRPRARSLALLNGAVVAGAMVALPATVVLEGELDWRASFAVLGGLAGLAAAAVAWAGRGLAAREGDEPAAGVLARLHVLANLALSALVFAALFASYTYLAAYLEAVAGLSTPQVGAALAGFALAGLAGNAAAARTADRTPIAPTGWGLGLFAAVMAWVAASGGALSALGPALAAWGALHAALFVICQSRLLQAAPDAPALASALNIAACNLGIAVGAGVGGWTVTRFGLRDLGWSAAGLALAALAWAAATAALSPRRPRLRRSP